MPGAGDDFYDIIDDGILDSLIIIGLVAALAFLVYYRQQRQLNGRRERDAQQRPQGQQADGGFFPPAGDPGFGEWVAGGVGH